MLINFYPLIQRLKSHVSDVYLWDFKAVSPSEFEMVMTFKATAGLIDKLFNQVAAQMSKSTKYKALIHADASNIEGFDVPKEQFNMAKVSVSRQILKIYKIVRDDGITIIRDKVKAVKFIKDNGVLNISLVLSGNYVRK